MTPEEKAAKEVAKAEEKAAKEVAKASVEEPTPFEGYSENELKEMAQEFFTEENDVVYATTDGNCFTKENKSYCVNHARTHGHKFFEFQK